MVLSANGSAKIRVEHATKVYETRTAKVPALDDVSIEVRDGELVCVLGPSGCGKTTLLWAMSGLHGLTSGSVVLDGTPVTGPRPLEIGMIFQDANLLPWRNLRQNLEFPFEIKHKKPDEQRIAALLEETGLAGFEKSYPRELSGGMQQRASIVRALAQDPEVLLMDEPFGALDAFTRDEMNLLLLRLWSETDKTIVFVTHNISEAIFLADRVVVMTPRPGRVAKVYDIELPRPRTIEMTFEPSFISLVQEIKVAVESGGRHLLEVE
jgi:NitT/TauT family transport system ATP-binding protein